MTTFNFILFFFVWVGGIISTKESVQIIDKSCDIKKVFNSDTLHLYFPLKEEGQDSAYNSTALDTFKNVGYSRMLYALKEPILASYEGDNETYRFTWLRTFHNPVSLRIEKNENKITLNVKVLSGAGGYEPGKITTNKTVSLHQKNWLEFKRMLIQIEFWKLPIEYNFRGFDGAEWILEGTTKDKYHFATRWSPNKEGNYGKCCMYLLKLAGIKVSERDIY